MDALDRFLEGRSLLRGLFRCDPYLFLLLWCGLLLVLSNGQQSLMAHDEGYYAAESRFMVEQGRWLARWWWHQPVYTHGVVLNWMIGGCYLLFGISDGVARLPGIVTCLATVLLTYEIGRIILGDRLAFLAAMILGVTPQWVLYGRLATQDIPLVCWELLGIWGLLQSEKVKRHRWIWGIGIGLIPALGFLTKSFMIVLPVIALLPYLVLQHRRHYHLANPGIYIGLTASVGLVVLWLVAGIQQYGDVVLRELFGKMSELSAKPYHADAGPFYYFWNLPLNSFPWFLFSVPGLWIARRQWRRSPYQSLLLGYPLLMFILLNLFPTRTPYYPLQIYPFIAFGAAIALDQLVAQIKRWPARWLSYAFGLLASVLIVAAIAILMFPYPLSVEVRGYATIGLVLGVGWILLPWLWHQQRTMPVRYWLATWILPPWFALATSGLIGMLGNYSPDVKPMFRQPEIAAIVQANPVNFGVATPVSGEDHQTWVLLSFYSPKLGRMTHEPADLPSDRYAWISPQFQPAQSIRQVVGTFRQWRLVQVGSNATQ